MGTKIQRLALLLAVVMGSLLAMGLSTPANAAGTTQISGEGVYDTTGKECDPPPEGYEDFDFTPMILTGDLEGCLYAKILERTDHGAPSGIYIETGQELVVASLNGGPVETFETTYRFESKWDPDVSTGVEVKGRCQHPIVTGSGTGGFAGATGRLDFKDEVSTGRFFYRGHIKLADAVASAARDDATDSRHRTASTAPTTHALSAC
jgi:hypothetical protein